MRVGVREWMGEDVETTGASKRKVEGSVIGGKKVGKQRER